MVDDKLNGLNGTPAKDLADSLRRFYEDHITPEMADLIIECDNVCEGDFNKLRQSYEDKVLATGDPKYSRDHQRIDRIVELHEGLRRRGIVLNGKQVDLIYLAQEFESERPSFENQKRTETGIIDNYIPRHYRAGTG